jgi:GNAT superfamily N-acetyltransferase
MSGVTVRQAADKKAIRDFLDVPFLTYAGDRHWVAPLFLERMEHLDSRKNPYFQHADVRLFVAYREGRPVGRISAQDDRLRLEIHKDNRGMFGFFDSLDEPEVAAALTAAAAQWLHQRGRSGMLGPFNFSINDEMGLLIDGFDTPPNMMMPHGRPYYAGLLERSGFTKAKDVIAYHYFVGPQPPLLQRIQKRALASGDFSLRPLNFKDLGGEVRLLMSIFNDAWSGNWGFVPFTEAELAKLAKDLKLLVNGKFGSVASYRGEEAAFVVTLPNLNEWISGMDGRLLPFNWAKLAFHVMRKRPKTYRMPLMGVRRKFHGTAIGSALATLVIDAVRAYQFERGAKEAELSWILEDNHPVRRLIESFGGTPYKTYRIYQKDF